MTSELKELCRIIILLIKIGRVQGVTTIVLFMNSMLILYF